MTAALALAEAVVARGHVGTEAHTLARALIAEARRADVAETRIEIGTAINVHIRAMNEANRGGPGTHERAMATKQQLADARARLAALTGKP